MMNEIVTTVLLVIGATFLLLAGVGVLRMPDLFTRMQSATKASTLGAACMLLAVAVYFNDLGITTRAIAGIFFFFITAPVTAHMIGRASYFLGVPLWSGTVRDELHGRYDLSTHMLNNNFATTVPSPITDTTMSDIMDGSNRSGTARTYDVDRDG
jgi:multicomponent Na+:H+ antiporter subunit G